MTSESKAAGVLFAQRFADLIGAAAVVFAVAPEGVPTALQIVDAIGSELDLVFAEAVASPEAPDVLWGAIADAGSPVTIRAPGHGVDARAFAAQWRAALGALQQRQALYVPLLRNVRAAGKVAVLVVDAAAPLVKTQASIAAVRRRGPSQLVLIARRAYEDDLQALCAETDDLAALRLLPRTAETSIETERVIQDREAIALLRNFRKAGPLH